MIINFCPVGQAFSNQEHIPQYLMPPPSFQVANRLIDVELNLLFDEMVAPNGSGIGEIMAAYTFCLHVFRERPEYIFFFFSSFFFFVLLTINVTVGYNFHMYTRIVSYSIVCRRTSLSLYIYKSPTKIKIKNPKSQTLCIALNS